TVTPSVDLQATVQLFDPSNNLIGAATASGPGVIALLQTIPANAAGVYTITITGANGTTGTFTAQLILNAAAQVETNGGVPNTDDSIATAQDLNNSFVDLGNGGARGAVLGQTEGLGVGTTIFLADFESGSQGFTVDNTPPSGDYAEGLWH